MQIRTAAATTSFTASGHLVVVDPASPITPMAIEAAGQWHPLARFDEGTIDSTARSLSNLNSRFVVYLKQGRVWRLDLRRATWPPSPSKVSSLTTAQICGISARAFGDRQASERSWLLFTGPGPDSACDTADDRQLAVRLDMTENESAVNVGSAVGGALRSTAGAIAGFVIREESQIRRVDASFANAVDLFAVASGNASFVLDNKELSAGKEQLLFIEGNQLRSYDLVARSGPASLLQLNQGECCATVVASDANSVYVHLHSSGVGGRLVRIGAANSIDVLVSETTNSIGPVLASPTRLIYASMDTFTRGYRSVPKTGGASVALSPTIECSHYSTVFVSGENVWYDCGPGLGWDYARIRIASENGKDQAQPTYTGDKNIPRVWIIRSDGTQPQRFDNAWIASASHASPMPLLSDGSTIYAVVVAHYNTAVDAQIPGTTLRAYEGASRKQLVEYGSTSAAVVPDYTSFVESFQWSQPALVMACKERDELRDIYFLQSDAAGLSRVTGFLP